MCNATPNPGHELVLTRLIDAPREKLFRCWTEPALMKKWFAPLPWTATHAEMDLPCAAPRGRNSPTPASSWKW
jgi:uncharacterized protein YndB with AHSA1/START domain